ncbi:MAG TPA: AAA family ATPase [Steroidobacteraceae bacterium]|nr:AAA family ATPase [Steroidobacteraceae bacterium]
MYLDHFKLKELPFRLSPDPAFLYLSGIHARAKAYMESTIWFTDGFVVITGEIGSGKTTLIETFLKEIDEDVVIAQINQTQLSPLEFLQTLLAKFGFAPFRMRKAELLATLSGFLIEQYANRRKVLVIVDEAQNLSNAVLEELRLLSGIETTKEKVLRIILAGQPELNDKLDSADLVQLMQRVRLRFHLTALTEQETAEYVRHRLRVAGDTEDAIFDPSTYPVIYRYTGGIPRLVNTLCDTALLAAFAQDRTTVTDEDLGSAIAELQWVEYAARTHMQHMLEDTAPQQRLPVGSLVLSLKGDVIARSMLVPGRFVIGRTPDNDLAIDSKFVSRHHAQVITDREGDSVIEDLNSTNGIIVGGKRVRRHRLAPGDVVRIGTHRLAYFREEPQPAVDQADEERPETAARDS